ncbi:unnamed protein product [Sphagnum jensenii]|uniref:Uncharacterized protein n=1 Tax=Sphagnum jensenii TaxID=128206 RepID=A0ABP1AW88_9BRYO
MSNMFSSCQSEPAPTNAPVGYSVHRMGCVFHPIPDPALTSIGCTARDVDGNTVASPRGQKERDDGEEVESLTFESSRIDEQQQQQKLTPGSSIISGALLRLLLVFCNSKKSVGSGVNRSGDNMLPESSAAGTSWICD